MLRWFTEEEFVYTMSPPLLGRDTVDEFLFGERRGFCEHYASAFAVLLRAAGIPARVVVGYQGGERNPYQAYLLVHQFDAHAWTEAWLDGRGWVRFDPTAAVAPDRIESGAGEALGAEFLADSPLAIERYRNVRLLGWMRMRWDMMTYHWARLVLNYDAERQGALLSDLLGRISPARVVAPISVRLAALGLERRRGEGPLDYARRVAAVRPDLGAELQALTADYVALSYGSVATQQRGARLQRLRAFRPRRGTPSR